MKTKFALIMIAILAITMSTEIFAQMRRTEMRERMRERIVDQLNLTESQKTKLDELRTNHQKKMIDLRANLEKKIVELKAIRKSDKLNRSDFIKLTKEINEIRNAMAMERANHQMDIYEMLDDNQKKIWRDMKPDSGLRDKMKIKMHRHRDLD